MESATIVVVMVVLSMVDARPKAMDIAAGPVSHNVCSRVWFPVYKKAIYIVDSGTPKCGLPEIRTPR